MHISRGTTRPLVVVALGASLLVSGSVALRGHDIPDQVVVQTVVKTERARLHVLVRLPLILLLNMDLPKRGPGYLDLTRMNAGLQSTARAAADAIPLFENGLRLTATELTARVSLPSDRSFAAFETALAHVHGPGLPSETNVFWNQGFVDVHLVYPIESPYSDFALGVAIAPELGDRLRTAVRYAGPDGTVRAYVVEGTRKRLVLDPRWHQAARTFLEAGFFHILGGMDHLLFLLCLVLPVRRLRALLLVITAFTAAHSATLLAAAFDLAPGGAWFPPLVETLIAASIVYMALDNVVGANIGHRWLVAFAFGLVHGFGFAFGLRETFQFAGSHVLVSLLSFNTGVELGQLAVLATLVPAMAFVFGRVVPERIGIVVISALVAHSGWHWMTERWGELRRVGLTPDALKAALSAIWWILLAALVWWVVRLLQGRAIRHRRTQSPAAHVSTA